MRWEFSREFTNRWEGVSGETRSVRNRRQMTGSFFFGAKMAPTPFQEGLRRLHLRLCGHLADYSCGVVFSRRPKSPPRRPKTAQEASQTASRRPRRPPRMDFDGFLVPKTSHVGIKM